MMKNMTTKELTLLGKDLKMARILVLAKHGFTSEEIAAVMEIPESTARRLVDEANNK
jgi:DNA-directed RNA polymerase specialized sigma24 family protein